MTLSSLTVRSATASSSDGLADALQNGSSSALKRGQKPSVKPWLQLAASGFVLEPYLAVRFVTASSSSFAAAGTRP